MLKLAKPSDRQAQAKLEALDHSQAVIEFTPDGMIIDANSKFLETTGYALDEVRGKHHRMFVEPGADMEHYRSFWDKLAHGEYQVAEYKRIGKDGKEVWLKATYNPVKDEQNRTTKVVKLASDITEDKRRYAEYEGQIAAINKAQAVIHFDLDGTILDANENFLKTLGYTLDEVRGKHHRMFVDPAYANSREYKEFWDKLRAGQFDQREYKRFSKDGKEVWIQASYNPIFDSSGKLFKVVKYATDITSQKLNAADVNGQIAAINNSQAVIHFDLNGVVTEVNDNFLNTVGYRREEVVGQHHRMFVDPEYARSPEYADFWRRLNEGQFDAAQYKRFGKDNKEIWIQASYNPIRDMNGKPFKVVKYATDITRQMQASHNVARASEQTLQNVQAVAAASEELNATTLEISKNMTMTKNAVDDIHRQSSSADQATQQLQQASTAMDEIVQLIQRIASQINLLALNATIESARAGEAGRGFAVVAGEVKNLATQTSNATDKIAGEIKAMQGVSNEVTGALASISRGVQSVQEFVNGVASAVEEQSASTREISVNMQTAMQGVAAIDSGLKAIVQR